MKQEAKFFLTGKYRITKTNSLTGEIVSVSEWIHNKIMLDSGVGVGLLIARLGGDTSNDCVITSAEIGTGDTAPTDSDTDLETPVVTGILTALQEISATEVHLYFYIPDANLPNGTYKEFGIRSGTALFARSILTPSFVKGSNEDTNVEYIISGNNA